MLSISKPVLSSNTASADFDTEVAEARHAETLLETDALQTAIFNSANFSSIETAGCDGYIKKPFRYMEFLAAVQSQLVAA